MRTLRIRKFWKKFCAFLLCMTLMANPLIAFAEEVQPGAEPGVIDVVGETESQVDESDVVAEEETVTTTTVSSEDESVSEMEETTSTEVTSEEMATTKDNITEAEDKISLQDEDVDYEKPTPDRVAEAIEKFSEAALHFAEIAEGAGKLSKVIAAGGGLAAIPGGTVAVLQLIGVVDDPTEKALSTIISKIDGVESTLNNMSSTLNQISNDLADMSADAKERDRQNKASESLRQYQDFRNTQVKELNTLIGEYQGKITAATRQWWENDGKKGILVLYAEDTSSKHTEGEIVSGYHYYESKEPLPVSINDLPKESDSGSKVILDKSYYVPSESVNLFFTPLSSNNMNVNTYSEDFVEAISPAITSAMNSRTGLICSEALYNEWDALNDDSKKATADLMATDILSSAIYQLSCETMSSAGNAEYVKDVIAAYKSYSENVMAKNRGLDALINMQFVTHGFEGEVKKDIKNICDSMIFSAGYYGTFALDIACQSSNISLKERQELQNIWTNTILFISDKEKSSLTGHDNYCYVRGAVINYDKYNLNSQIVSTYKTYPSEKKYIHYYADADVTGNWKISDINGKDAIILPLESDYSRVLYNQYLRSRLDLDGKDSKESFAQYLRRNGVEIAYDFNGTFVTRYSGVQTFGLGENLSMKASNSYGNAFTNGTAYTINKTGKDNNCFILHDKVIADTFDTSGNFASNSIVAARAYYQEHKWFWYVDEGVVFATDGVNISHNVNKSKYNYFSDLNTDTVKLSKDINVLSIVQRDLAIVDEDSLLSGATIKYDEPTSSVPEYAEKNDWSDYPSKHIVTYADDVIQNDATYELEIDRAIEDAINSNEFTASEVALSAVEKKELINRMRSILALTQNKLKECDFLEYSDDELKEFSDGGYGYEDMIKDIATMTLPECYFNNYEECLLPLNCMKQAFKYEPSVKVKFVRNGNVIEKRVYQAYIVTPLFVIWDSINKEYYEYEIDYDEMDTSSALVSYYELKVRIPYIGDQTGSSLVMEQRNGQLAANTVSNEDKPYMKINVTDSNALCYYKTSKADDILQDEELSVKEIGPQGYTGNAIKPSVTVSYKGNTLINGTDYTVSYIDNNKVTNSAKCVVKFKGIYTGSITKSFKIISADVKNLRMKTFSTNSVTLQWDKAPGVDGYRVYRYFPNTNSYSYLGWVNGKTNTYQVKNLTNGYDFWFVVFSYTYHNPQRTSYSFGNDSDIFTCSTAPVKLSFSQIYKNMGELELKWNKVNSSGYEIWYGLKSDFSDAKKVIIRSGHTTSFKTSGLDPNRNYYLRIQAYRYNNGKYYFGGFNKAKGTYYCNLYMTYYSKYPDNYNRTTNIMIASNAIDGTIIYPGQLFDFNDIVGPRTYARGYRDAAIFSGGNDVTAGVGGGICQVASTIFNTALYANVQIVERHQHSQRVSYVPLGRDAAIYGNSQNFIWRNSTPYPIRIIMSVGSNTLRCSFYTPVYLRDPDVSLSVSQSGRNFTMRRYVNGSVNYTCKSNY